MQIGSGVSITLAYTSEPSDNSLDDDDDAVLDFIGCHNNLVQAYFEDDLVSCQQANASLREEVLQLKTLLSKSEQKYARQDEEH